MDLDSVAAEAIEQAVSSAIHELMSQASTDWQTAKFDELSHSQQAALIACTKGRLLQWRGGNGWIGWRLAVAGESLKGHRVLIEQAIAESSAWSIPAIIPWRLGADPPILATKIDYVLPPITMEHFSVLCGLAESTLQKIPNKPAPQVKGSGNQDWRYDHGELWDWLARENRKPKHSRPPNDNEARRILELKGIIV